MILRRTLLSGAAACIGLPSIIGRANAQSRPEYSIPIELTQGGPSTITRVPTSQPLIAMTFDDGPHASLTPQLLDILAARNIRATFFVLGNRVNMYPRLTQRIAAEGHEIGNHSWSHPRLTSLGNEGLMRELDNTSMAIQEAVGRPPVTMRPPYGLLSQRQRNMIQETRYLPTILWSIDPQDWRRPGSSVIANRIVGAAHTGAVILAHDIIGSTVRAMPAALDGLIARGYRFVTVSELVGWPRWSERNIRLRYAQAEHI
jgi:peptidoglycan-N-acetylglucosamine deacetylase